MNRTIDVNTSDETVDNTPSGQTFRPDRYTTTTRDFIRVGVWTQLQTLVGTYRFDLEQGLDAELILDPGTSESERSALVAEVILRYPGVTAILEGPTVTIEDGTIARIEVTCLTVDGELSLVA